MKLENGGAFQNETSIHDLIESQERGLVAGCEATNLEAHKALKQSLGRIKCLDLEELHELDGTACTF